MSIGWIFLIVVALILAWYLGYRAREEKFSPEGANVPRDYLLGLNFLLNEEPDKAVDIFIKMLEVDSSTVETHLAVGKLFRRRGEVDRAIRIHQNLIARPQLSKSERAQALFELGQDYLSVGVLDRAERIFLEVVGINQFALAALRCLLDIYQQEKAWENAIATAHRIENITKQSMQSVIAHYYCELAEIEISKNNVSHAKQQLEKAFDVDRECVRASLLIAKIEVSKKDYRAALKNLKRVKTQNSDYLSEAIDMIATCFESLEEEEKLVDYLLHVLDEHPKIPVVLILSERIRKWKGDKVAAKFVADYVRRYPSISGLHLFINLYLSSAEGRARDDLLILQGLMHKLIADKPEYQCISCGFSGKTLHWQCPGCKNWSSIKPVHSLEI